MSIFKVVCSVMQSGYLYDRETIIRESARHLGFARATETVKKAFQSAIRVAVRNGIIDSEKHGIIRP